MWGGGHSECAVHVFPARCCAALGDVAKARYLREVSSLADKINMETVSDSLKL